MAVAVRWISQTGTKTKDNRDCAGVGIRKDGVLCVVLDGSTSGPHSGDLARQISRAVVDWYVSSEGEITSEVITGRIREIHGALSKEHPRDSASYMIAHFRSPREVLVLHAGDCLLGRYDDKTGIDWVSQPHTLANVAGNISIPDIVDVPARQRLTRSFRAREFMPPDAIEVKVSRELVIATDGFWAELSSGDQALFLNGGDVPMGANGDDRSILRLLPLESAGEGHVQFLRETDNLYARSIS
ncbi:protein phosphatase 2C domain-containing protein [Mesorhizobium sp. M1312]|uniref:protein phosphatase 2C domain-containing protein n=1 Tax=unclassified Mesorhizobium TaxID=325217 RepID=UPI00333595D5